MLPSMETVTPHSLEYLMISAGVSELTKSTSWSFRLLLMCPRAFSFLAWSLGVSLQGLEVEGELRGISLEFFERARIDVEKTLETGIGSGSEGVTVLIRGECVGMVSIMVEAVVCTGCVFGAV